MALDFTHDPSPLGVPTLYEIEEGTSTATYPHLVTRAGISIFQRTCIDVRIGPREVDICNDTPHHGGEYVQHPKPFDADGTLSTACRTLLIAGVQDAVSRCKFQMQRCLVWSPTSCSYVEANGSICNTSGVALPPRIAFEAARLAVIANVSNFLKPGINCTLVGANDKDKDAERLVVVLKYIGAFPHAGVSEGYWVGTLDRLPFATIEVYKAADRTFNTQPNLSNAAIVDRKSLRPLADGKTI